MRRWLWVMVLGFLPCAAVHAEVVSTQPKASDVSLELKFGSYAPDLDKSAGLKNSTPYESTFGPKSAMLMFQFEVDKFLFRKFGSLGVGFSAGYAEKYGASLEARGTGNPQPSQVIKTGLHVIPLKLLALYRLDYLALRWKVPLVPYAKLGFIYQPWWTVNGSASEQSGGRMGWGGVVGLSFLLDVLEPQLAKDFSSDVGVRHSYFFVEYQANEIRGFSRHGMDFSNRNFFFGMAFDF